MNPVFLWETQQSLSWAGWAVVAALTAMIFAKLKSRDWPPSDVLAVLVLVSGLWWTAAGEMQVGRIVALVSTSLIGGAIGSIAGFLFSSNEEEQAVSKVRDWLIGIITGLTIAEIGKQGSTVIAFLGFLAKGHEEDLGIHASMMVVYSTIGFLFLYLNRELYLNTSLAEARRRQKQAGSIAKELPKTLPDPERPGSELGHAQTAAQTEGVDKFIASVELAVQEGRPVTFDELATLGRSLYYRNDLERAINYLKAAARLKPKESDSLNLMIAQALGESKGASAAARFLDDWIDARSAPVDAYKLLGYYLLWDETRLVKAAQCTEHYLATHPQDSGALFNLACAAAQLFAKSGDGKDKSKALDNLGKALKLHPAWKESARSLTGEDGDFRSLRADKDFLELVA